MFRDKDDALKRLEALLLEEEEEPETTEEEEADEPLSPEDTAMPADDPSFYRNYANDYMAYNSDRTDVSPEEMSHQLEAPDRDWISICLALLAAVELLAILAVLLFLLYY